MKGKSYKRWEDTGIYVDTYELFKAVHSVIYDFPKKDRVVLGDKIHDKASSMIAHAGMAYKLADRRKDEIDLFICDFEILKAYLRLAIDLKFLQPAKQVKIFSYIQRIDEGIMKWRKSVMSKIQAPKVSNDDLGPDKQESRGGGGFI